MEFVYTFVNLLFNILFIAILIRVILSWVRIDPSNPLVQIIFQITEPVLGPIRRLLPSTGGFDFSPIIALVLLDIIRRLLLQFLF